MGEPMSKGRIVFQDSQFFRIRHSRCFQVLLKGAPGGDGLSMALVGRRIRIDLELCPEGSFPPQF